MQIWDKVMAQTNNPAQQPKKAECQREGKNLFIRFQHHPLEIPSVNGFYLREGI